MFYQNIERYLTIFLFGLIAGIIATFINLLFPDMITDRLSPSNRSIMTNNINTTLVWKYPVTSLLEPLRTFPKTPAISAHAYTVVDLTTGTLLSSKNVHAPHSVASLVKLITAATVLDVLKPTDILRVSANAANQVPTIIGLQEGALFTVHELLSAMLISSANDAAQTLADGVDTHFKRPVFIDMMNRKIKDLGVHNTNFENPSGLDSKNSYSTAYDLSLIISSIIKSYPLIEEISNRKRSTIQPSFTHPAYHLTNWNALLSLYPGVTGLKIGNTAWAGTTSVVSANRNNHRILVILLGEPDTLTRDRDTVSLLNWGFSATTNAQPITISDFQFTATYHTWLASL